MKHLILKQTVLFGLVLLLVVGFAVLSPAHTAAASPKATKYCQHQTGSAQTACQTGYDGQVGGQSVHDACQAYHNDDLITCQSAWGHAAHEDPAVYCGASKCDFVAKYVNPVINLFSLVFGLIAVISLIAGGIQYSTSEGDPQKAGSAKSRITNTIVAVFAYMFLYAFLQFLIPGGIFH